MLFRSNGPPTDISPQSDIVEGRGCEALAREKRERRLCDPSSRLLGLAISNRGFSHAPDRTGRSAVALGISRFEEVLIHDSSDLN